ncbi:MAG: hypothetical protein K6T73_01195 [Candidatus Bathyarchaeota archaeon]|nr:hypothetical protein [Candidatus Bathyarchaeota archaeon]
MEWHQGMGGKMRLILFIILAIFIYGGVMAGPISEVLLLNIFGPGPEECLPIGSLYAGHNLSPLYFSKVDFRHMLSTPCSVITFQDSIEVSSAVTDSSRKYSYFGTKRGFPAYHYIVKVNNSDFSEVDSLNIRSVGPFSFIFPALIDKNDENLYVVERNYDYKLSKIRLSDFQKVDEIYLGEDLRGIPAIDDNYIYFSRLDAWRYTIRRIDLRTLTIDPIFVELEFPNYITCILLDNNFGYFGANFRTLNTFAILKIRLSTLEIVDTLYVSYNHGELTVPVMGTDGYAYFATTVTLPQKSKIIRLNLSTFSIESILELKEGDIPVRYGFVDSGYLYIATRYYSNSFLQRINLSTFEQDYSLFIGIDVNVVLR